MFQHSSTRRLQYVTATAAAAILYTFATSASAAVASRGQLDGVYSASAIADTKAAAKAAAKAVSDAQALVDAAALASKAALTTDALKAQGKTYVDALTADSAAAALVVSTASDLTSANTALTTASTASNLTNGAATLAAGNLTTAKASAAAALTTYNTTPTAGNLTALNAAQAAQATAQTASDAAAAAAVAPNAATAAASDKAIKAATAADAAVTAKSATANAVIAANVPALSGYVLLLNSESGLRTSLASITTEASPAIAAGNVADGGVAVLTGVAATANTATNAKAAARALLGTSTGADQTFEVEMVRGLNNEETQRVAADVALGGRITTETNRATAAESALGTRITVLTAQVKKDIAAATAVSVALGGNSFLPGKKFNLTVNVGSYDGESALAAQFGFMVNDSLAINGGVASGFGSGSSTAVRGGFTYGW